MFAEKNAGRKPQHTYLLPGRDRALSLDYLPHYYMQAKIDIDDVRSGYHESRSVGSALAVAPVEADFRWLSEIMVPVDPDRVVPEPPQGVRILPLPAFLTDDWPERLEGLFADYWVRHEEAAFFRNQPLQVYSRCGESLEEFAGRCLEMLGDSFRPRLNQVREVFNRRLELIREKYGEELKSEEFSAARSVYRKRDSLRILTDRMDEFFLRMKLSVPCEGGRNLPAGETPSDLEMQLQEIEDYARREAAVLAASYRERAHCIDECTVHPALKDIHFVRASILWMPRQEGAI